MQLEGQLMTPAQPLFPKLTIEPLSCSELLSKAI
jgi:hypothetical protein